MIRYVPLAALLALSAGCQQARPPATESARLPLQSSAAAQRTQPREAFLAEIDRRVAAARRGTEGATPEMVREMEELLQTLRRSPNPELLLNAMLAGASPDRQAADGTPGDLYQQALAAEDLGLRQDALALYRRAAAGGHPASVARLRELDPSTPPPAPQAMPLPRVASPTNAARLLAVPPLLTGPAGSATPTLSAEEAFARAAALEQDNQLERALALYVDSSQRGHGLASQRLMEIFANGAPGLTRDYVVAVKYKELALRQGTRIETLPRR